MLMTEPDNSLIIYYENRTRSTKIAFEDRLRIARSICPLVHTALVTGLHVCTTCRNDREFGTELSTKITTNILSGMTEWWWQYKTAQSSPQSPSNPNKHYFSSTHTWCADTAAASLPGPHYARSPVIFKYKKSDFTSINLICGRRRLR